MNPKPTPLLGAASVAIPGSVRYGEEKVSLTRDVSEHWQVSHHPSFNFSCLLFLLSWNCRSGSSSDDASSRGYTCTNNSAQNGGMPKLTGETNVDEQVNATATLQKDTQRREDDGQDDLEDVGALCMFRMLSWTRRLSTEELSKLLRPTPRQRGRQETLISPLSGCAYTALVRLPPLSCMSCKTYSERHRVCVSCRRLVVY